MCNFNVVRHAEAVTTIIRSGGLVAFLSTPSLYFSLAAPDRTGTNKVLDFDSQWASDPGYVKYDFNKPLGKWAVHACGTHA
jgi:hypothetical protein